MDMTHFNAEKTRDNLVQWIADWFEQNGKDKLAVLGISGGKDSTIVAALCARAIGAERVFGVMMPNGHQKDIGDSIRVCEALGIPNIVVNIADGYRGISDNVEACLAGSAAGYKELSDQALVNLPPRLRTATLYAISQTVGGRVINTSNKSEYMTGYFTRWGDECGDCKPLINLLKSEVVAIGLTMPEIPRDLVEKAPSDGLTDKTDEDNIGFSYDALDNYLRLQRGDPEVEKQIEKRIAETAFKRKPVPAFDPWHKED